MKHYGFEDINIGMHEEFSIVITEKQMQIFAELSGDYNPMHVDAEYAKDRGFCDKVVYGMLSSSFYSALVGMYLPGEKSLLNKYDVNCLKPVYIGDLLTIYGEVVDKRQATQRIKIKAKIINQNGEVVNTADIIVSFTG